MVFTHSLSFSLAAAPANRTHVDDTTAKFDEVTALGRKLQLGHVSVQENRLRSSTIYSVLFKTNNSMGLISLLQKCCMHKTVLTHEF